MATFTEIHLHLPFIDPFHYSANIPVSQTFLWIVNIAQNYYGTNYMNYWSIHNKYTLKLTVFSYFLFPKIKPNVESEILMCQC